MLLLVNLSWVYCWVRSDIPPKAQWEQSTVGEVMPFKEAFWSERPFMWKMKLPWCSWLHWQLTFSVTCVVFWSLAKAHHCLCHWSWNLIFPGLECDTETYLSKPFPETMPPTSVLVMTAGHPTCPKPLSGRKHHYPCAHCRGVVKSRRNLKTSEWAGRHPFFKPCTWCCCRLCNRQPTRRLSFYKWRTNTSWIGCFSSIWFVYPEMSSWPVVLGKEGRFLPFAFHDCWIKTWGQK